MDLIKFDYVRFTWADINGISKSKIVPGVYANDMQKNGLTCYSGTNAMGPTGEMLTIPGVSDSGFKNMLVRPVDNQIFPVPWVKVGDLKTGEVLCETFWDDNRPQVNCPRYAARRQVEALAREGFEFVSGFECEFIVSRKDTGEKLFKSNDFASTLSFAENAPLMYALESQMRQAGIGIEVMHTEYSPGQFEFSTRPERGLRAADNVFRMKEAIKEITSQHGCVVTFMSKPSSELGNGLHFSHSLIRANVDDDTKFVFFDSRKPNHMSDVYRWWVGGLVKHGRALTALCSPTVNCYRRLHNSWAPTKINWGIDDRSTSFRTKNYSPSGSYVENRLPGGSANPYLVVAATIAAGLDGIRNKIECPVATDPSAQDVPHTLAEALMALTADKVIVEEVGEELIQWFEIMKDNIDLVKLNNSNVKDSNDTEGFKKEVEMFFRAM